jgi:hypothetical protein
MRAVAAAAAGPARKAGGLQGDQLYDLLCVFIFVATVAFLRFLPSGTIYFWLKDLTQEFLKLHVIHGAVEIFDKVHPCPRPCLSLLRVRPRHWGACGRYYTMPCHMFSKARGGDTHCRADTVVFAQISCSFAVDALEALAGTCGLCLSTSGRRQVCLNHQADVIFWRTYA